MFQQNKFKISATDTRSFLKSQPEKSMTCLMVKNAILRVPKSALFSDFKPLLDRLTESVYDLI